MNKLSQQACKIANRVSLGMVFAEASMHRDQAQLVVEDAFDSTRNLLLRINAAELRSWYEGFASVFAIAQTALVGDPGIRSRFVATHCDVLHAMGLHQKTVASVGDELGEWNFGTVSMDEFGEALDSLDVLVTEHSETLADSIERQAGNESTRKRRALIFSHAVCGLAIVLYSIDVAAKQSAPRSEACASMATFGARLTISSVNRLFEVCELDRV